jgi:hypothetical protein
MYFFYNIFIVIFLFFIIFWVKPKHYIIDVFLNKIRFIFWYLGLWHAWNVFVNPPRNNKIVYIKKKFENKEEQTEILYSPLDFRFLNRNKKHLDIKFMDNFFNNDYVKQLMGNYIISKDNQIKEIEFIIESTEVPNLLTKSMTNKKISSYHVKSK